MELENYAQQSGPALKAQPGELRFQIEIKRKATGLVETFEMIGHEDPAKLAEIQENRRKLAAGEYLDPSLLVQSQE